MENSEEASELERSVEEAKQRAEHLCENLCDRIEVASLTLKSKLPFKALSLREVLSHRFADQSFCAACALESEHPISAATLTRGTMETFARLLETNNYLAQFFEQPDIEALDVFLMNRLFGARNREGDWPVATNILGCIDKVERMVPRFRENYDRLSEVAHPNYLGGIGILQKIDTENHVAHLGDKDRKDRATGMIVHILIGNQIGFEATYNALETSIRELNELFENEALKH